MKQIVEFDDIYLACGTHAKRPSCCAFEKYMPTMAVSNEVTNKANKKQLWKLEGDQVYII